MLLLQYSKLDDKDLNYCNHSENGDEGTNLRDISKIKLVGLTELWDVGDENKSKQK